MPSLDLDFLGTRARLTAESADALDELRRDFSAFAADDASPRVRVDLCARACSPPPGPWDWGWRGFRARTRGATRLIRYDDGAWAEHDRARERVVVHATDSERLRELAFLAVLSRVGEALDDRGLHRVHALGYAAGGGAGLVLLPSGGGKTSLALELLRRGRMRLLSDESPLVDAAGAVHPFPLRLALRPGPETATVPAASLRPFRRRGYGEKLLLDPAERGALERAPVPARWLLIGTPSAGSPRADAVPRARALAALLAPLVVGAGLAQMAEYMARADVGLAANALSRLRAALALTRAARCGVLRMGSEGPARALDALEGFSA